MIRILLLTLALAFSASARAAPAADEDWTAFGQVLTLVEIPTTIAASMRQLIYGVLLIAFMLFRPQGIVGERL